MGSGKKGGLKSQHCTLSGGPRQVLPERASAQRAALLFPPSLCRSLRLSVSPDSLGVATHCVSGQLFPRRSLFRFFRRLFRRLFRRRQG